LVGEATRETISKEERLLIVAVGKIEGINSQFTAMLDYEIRLQGEAHEITTVRKFTKY